MISLYLLFLLFVIVFELVRSKRVLVDFLTIFHAFFVMTYLLVPIFFLMDPSELERWRFLAVLPQAAESMYAFLSITIGYVSLVAGYVLVTYRGGGNQVVLASPYLESVQLRAVLVFFLVSALAFLTYAYGHGGILELLLKGKHVRAGRAHAGVYQYFAYFAAGLTLSSLLFYSFSKYSARPALRRRSLILFFISFVVALCYAVGTAGRGNIGILFLLVFLLWLNTSGAKFRVKQVLVVGIFGVFIFALVRYGKSVLWTIPAIAEGPDVFLEAFANHNARYNPNGGSGIVERMIGFLRNVDHPIVSIYQSLMHPEVFESPRFFWDWPRALVDSIPGVNQPELVVSSTPSGLNKEFFLEYIPTVGYIPPGWVAMKIINGGVAWLALGSFIAGYIGGKIQSLLLANWFSSPLIPAVYLVAAFFWKDYLIGPDPFMFFLPNLSKFVLILMLCILFVVKLSHQEKGKGVVKDN